MRAILPAHPSVPALIEDVLIIVSELVTNAVRYGGSTGILQWSLDGGHFLEVAVTDARPGSPAVMQAGPKDEHGRGLFVVMRLSERFGVQPDPQGGKRVWARLAIHPEVERLILNGR